MSHHPRLRIYFKPAHIELSLEEQNPALYRIQGSDIRPPIVCDQNTGRHFLTVDNWGPSYVAPDAFEDVVSHVTLVWNVRGHLEVEPGEYHLKGAGDGHARVTCEQHLCINLFATSIPAAGLLIRNIFDPTIRPDVSFGIIVESEAAMEQRVVAALYHHMMISSTSLARGYVLKITQDQKNPSTYNWEYIKINPGFRNVNLANGRIEYSPAQCTVFITSSLPRHRSGELTTEGMPHFYNDPLQYHVLLN